MTKPQRHRPVVRTQQDLETMWRTLMEPLGFASHSVWMSLIGADDRPTPLLAEVQDDGSLIGEIERAGLADLLRQLRDDLDPGGRWAFLRSRPGRGGTTDQDREWARMLYDAGHAADVPVEVVHLATDTHLVPIPLDELQALAS
jgi:hypothetical protein